MRQIKFRAKLLKENRFIYGDLRHGGYTKNDEEIYICVNEGMTVNYPVDVKTIGQYTGIKDKKGIEIFEGDIIIKNGKKRDDATVEWHETLCAFCVLFESIGQYKVLGIFDAEDDKIEVIGNIYERTKKELKK